MIRQYLGGGHGDEFVEAGISPESHAASISSLRCAGFVTTVPAGSTSATRHCIEAIVPAPWGSANGELLKINSSMGMPLLPVNVTVGREGIKASVARRRGG
jgi:hypothetical protein